MDDGKKDHKTSLRLHKTKLQRISSQRGNEDEFLTAQTVTMKTPLSFPNLPELDANKVVEYKTSNSDISEYDTLPMMVLKDLTSRQGEAIPVMQSEISGAASNAAIVGIGNIIGSILKFSSNYLIQVAFGATLYGLYSIVLSLIQ